MPPIDHFAPPVEADGQGKQMRRMEVVFLSMENGTTLVSAGHIRAVAEALNLGRSRADASLIPFQIINLDTGASSECFLDPFTVCTVTQGFLFLPSGEEDSGEERVDSKTNFLKMLRKVQGKEEDSGEGQ